MDKKELMQEARDAKARAYVPYSNFPVGAAILMKDGTVITGVNIENASFGATNCAERTAIFTAINQGYEKGDFKALAIAGNTQSFLPPCSICRQVMVEFFEGDVPIYLTNDEDDILELELLDLVPYIFNSLDI